MQIFYLVTIRVICGLLDRPSPPIISRSPAAAPTLDHFLGVPSPWFLLDDPTAIHPYCELMLSMEEHAASAV